MRSACFRAPAACGYDGADDDLGPAKMQEHGGEGSLDAAIQRLDRAVTLLESRVSSALRNAKSQTGGLFDQDRSDLAAQLDQARGRERELEQAGAEAARALGRAIAEIRAALGEDTAASVLEREV